MEEQQIFEEVVEGNDRVWQSRSGIATIERRRRLDPKDQPEGEGPVLCGGVRWNRGFESISLQRRVCELLVPKRGFRGKSLTNPR
jgi:hypothetical protein